MSYYQQPMGDYKTYGYAGDPGFLSSLWKGFKKVAKFIPGPIGTIARVAGVVGVATGAAKILTPPALPGPAGTRAFGYPSFPAVGQVGAPNMLGQPWMTAGRGQAIARGLPSTYTPDAAGCCPTGFHPDKRTGTKCVRNRRMNVANPRALRRSMRRVQGFEKLARRTIQFTRRVKMKKRGS